MKRLMMIAAMVAAVGGFGTATQAADTAGTGLKQGDPVGAFYVTKAAGAKDDGVEQGQELCYRCRYGQRPMVLVFARETSEPLTSLVRKLNAAVAEHDDQQLKAVVTLLDANASDAQKQAKKLAEQAGAEHVPVVVSKDGKAGPENYELHADTDVTVVLAKNSQVVATHSFDASEIDAEAVLRDAKKLAKE